MEIVSRGSKANRICQYCGKPIPESRSLQAKYCSNKCNQDNLSKRASIRNKEQRAKARAERAEMVECGNRKCTKEFLRETYRQRFCSEECREEEQKREHKEKMKQRVELRPTKMKPELLTRGKITYTGYKQKGGSKDD